MSSAISYSREQRFRFIEALVLWEGHVQRKQVSSAFGIAQNHVTNDLRAYEASHPNNLRFNPRIRAYEPDMQFKPAYISTDPAEYFSLLYAHADSRVDSILQDIGGQVISAEIIPNPPHGLVAKSIQILIKSIRTKSGVKITYNSMSSEHPTQRIIWPHSFVHTGYRWQVRAFDGLKEEFRDLVIQRMSNLSSVDDLSPKNTSEDKLWNDIVEVRVKPNPALSNHQQSVVANDFGMKKSKSGFVWTLKLRKCLFPYFAIRYNLQNNKPHEIKTNHRLVLENYNELEQFFF